MTDTAARITVSSSILAKKAYPKLDLRNPDEPDFWNIMFESEEVPKLIEAITEAASKSTEFTIRITRKLGRHNNRHAVTVTYEPRAAK